MTIEAVATPCRQVHRLIAVFGSVAMLHPTIISSELERKFSGLELRRQRKRIRHGIVLLLDGLPAHEANMPAQP